MRGVKNRRVWLIVGVVVAALAGLGAIVGGDDRPGDDAVYDRIGSLSDCQALQDEFDSAAADHDRAVPGSDEAEAATSYMLAAEDRRDVLGC